jgi:hypothetical protein
VGLSDIFAISDTEVGGDESEAARFGAMDAAPEPAP